MDKSVIAVYWGRNTMECVYGSGADRYVLENPIGMVSITVVILNKQIFSQVQDYEKYHHTMYSNVYTQLKMLQISPEFCLIKTNKIVSARAGSAQSTGYNAGYAMRGYMDIIAKMTRLSRDEMIYVKKMWLELAVYPYLPEIVKNSKNDILV